MRPLGRVYDISRCESDAKVVGSAPNHWSAPSAYRYLKGRERLRDTAVSPQSATKPFCQFRPVGPLASFDLVVGGDNLAQAITGEVGNASFLSLQAELALALPPRADAVVSN